MTTIDVEWVKFRKQFFLSRGEATRMPSEHWRSQRLHDGWLLSHHEDLEIASEGDGDFKVVLLGNAYDLDFTSRTNNEVAASLVEAAEEERASFAGFEARLSRLSGRHVVLAFGQEDDRIYHDAGGLKSVFFVNTADDDLCVGSQPALLEHFGKTRRDDGAYDAFVAKPHSASFSAYFVPYEHVTQLLPNRYLSLRKGLAQRFWPVAGCQESSLNESADTVYQLTKASIEAHFLRGKLALTLTGGFDSRMLLAATDPNIRERLKIATSISKGTPDHDRWIPKRIGKLLGLSIGQSNIEEVQTSKSEVIKQLHCNVGGMSSDASLPRVLGVSATLGDHTQGAGLCAEVFRNFYPRGNVDTEALTPQMLADVSGFRGNDLAVPGLERWMSELPDGWTSRHLDLLYWEQRLGVWAAAHLAFKEALFEVSPPMNSRSILSAGLCAPAEMRCKPYHLAREIIRRGEPRLLNIPFNQDRTRVRLQRKIRYRLSRLKSALAPA